MKFSAILSVFATVSAAPFFFGGGNSNSVTTRNATACAAYVVDQGNKINSLTTELGTIAASARKNDIIGLLKLQTTAQKLIDLVKDTGSQINATCPNDNSITITQALGMAQTLLKLPAPINTTMTNLINKKDTFDHAILYFGNLSWLVKSDLEQVVAGINGMVGAVNAQVASSASGVVTNVATQILAPIYKAQQVYKNWL